MTARKRLCGHSHANSGRDFAEAVSISILDSSECCVEVWYAVVYKHQTSIYLEIDIGLEIGNFERINRIRRATNKDIDFGAMLRLLLT